MADTPSDETPAKPTTTAKARAKPASRGGVAKKPAASTGRARAAIDKAEAQMGTLAKSTSTRAKAAATKAKASATKVKDKLPPATSRNVAIGAAAAVVAVGAGLAATVGRKRIAKASGDVVETVKKKIASTRAKATKTAVKTTPDEPSV